MSRYIPEALRQYVSKKADYACEYCRLPDRYSFLAFHIEHIISIKHGGETQSDNLAYACATCNVNKGSDIATFLNDSRSPVRFYNPRFDAWKDHFILDYSGQILHKTDIGAATVKIFDLNHPESIIERLAMINKGIMLIVP